MNYRLTKGQVWWVLFNYDCLRSGLWPDPKQEACEGRGGLSCRARFENPCLLAGEVGARVKLCGVDGLLVEARFGLGTRWPMSEADLERERHIPIREIRRTIGSVVEYCTGAARGMKQQPDGLERSEAYDVWKGRYLRKKNGQKGKAPDLVTGRG